MPSIEIQASGGPQTHRLDGDRFTIGKAPSNDLPVPDDPTMSRLHALLERYPSGWAIRDLGSRNGTYVNGERIWGEHALRPGDEIRLGRTRIVYRPDGPHEEFNATEAPRSAPDLTPRERDVLVSLCKPLLTGDAFSEPAAVAQIAADLVVTKAAVKQHLLRLYDKFAIYEGDGPRRVRLANEALERGAVSLTDLRGRHVKE